MANAPLTAFAGAQDKNAEQQRALLAAIAESGSAGAATYKQAQDQNQQLQQTALARAASAPSPELAGTMALNTAMLDNSRQSFDQDIARQSAANSTYMSEVGAAIPIVESRTRMGVEQMLAEQQQRREAAAAEREMAQMNLQGQREQLAGQREARAGAAAERAADAKNGGITPFQREQIRLQEVDNNRAASLDDEKRRAAADEARVTKREDYLKNLLARTSDEQDDDGKYKPSNGFLAVRSIVEQGATLDEALRKFKTPRGHPLHRATIERWVNEYRQA